MSNVSRDPPPCKFSSPRPAVKAPKEESRALRRLFVVGESDDALAYERLSKVSYHLFVIADPR